MHWSQPQTAWFWSIGILDRSIIEHLLTQRTFAFIGGCVLCRFPFASSLGFTIVNGWEPYGRILHISCCLGRGTWLLCCCCLGVHAESMSLQKLRFKSAPALELFCYIQLCPREPKQQSKIHDSRVEKGTSIHTSLYVPPASSLQVEKG
jgi:hypothetical protein